MLRKPVKVIKLAVWVAVTLVVAATFLALLWPRQTRLVLEEPDSGQLYAWFPVEEGSRFSITFIHSVNKTPLTDVYEIRQGEIYVTETKFYGFGAGGKGAAVKFVCKEVKPWQK